MSNIILYSYSASPPCRSVLMVKEILGLEITIKNVNMAEKEHLKPEYIEKNPLHTVPLLEEDDFLLADSHAIITYLVSKYGADQQETLYPSDLKIRATVDQRLIFDATLFVNIRKEINRVRAGGMEITTDYKSNIVEAYEVLEKYLEKTQFVATDHLTVADIAFVATISTFDILMPIDEWFVKIHKWWNKLKQFDWYQKGNLEGLAIIEGSLKSVFKK